jgi:hypothetical protein
LNEEGWSWISSWGGGEGTGESKSITSFERREKLRSPSLAVSVELELVTLEFRGGVSLETR